MGTLVNKFRSNPLGSVDAASFQFTILADDIITFDHGFAMRPRHIDLFIVAVSATLGYAIGDKIKISNSDVVSLAVNKQTAYLRSAGVPTIIRLDTNAATAITPAAWNWFITLED